MELLGYIAIFGMGITLGVMGGGGSILTVPIMVYLFGISPTAATGYSLFVVGLTALIGSTMYIRKKDIAFKTGFSFAVPSLIGVNLSRGIIMPTIPDVIFSFPSFSMSKEVLIMIVFASLMIAASYSMIKRPPLGKTQPAPKSGGIATLGFQGFIIGMIAGFVGAGGGFLITPALVLLAGLSMRVAIGTSLLVIALQSLAGFVGDLLRGTIIDWHLLGAVAGIAVLGIMVGSAFAHHIPERKLKISFGWFVLIMGGIILLEQVRHISAR